MQQALLTLERAFSSVDAGADEESLKALSYIAEDIHLANTAQLDKWLAITSRLLLKASRVSSSFSRSIKQRVVDIYDRGSITWGSVEISELTRDLITSNTKEFMRILSKNLSTDSNQDAPELLESTAKLWRLWVFMLSLSRGGTFVSCLGKDDNTFILPLVSQLMKPTPDTFCYRHKELSLREGHKCLCLTLNLLISIYRSEVTKVEVFKKLEILIPYLLRFLSLPCCNQEAISEFVSAFRGLLSACWTTQEDILNMRIMTNTGSEIAVIDFIFGLKFDSDCIRAYKVKSCLTFNPESEEVVARANKGLFSKSHASHIQSFVVPINVLLNRLEILVKILRTLIADTGDLLDDSSKFECYYELLSDTVFGWQVTIVAIGMELVKSSAQNEGSQDRSFFTMWSEDEEEIALYSAREKEVSVLQKVHSLMVDSLDFWSNSPKAEKIDDLREHFFESFWWILHRFSGFSAAALYDSNRTLNDALLPYLAVASNNSMLINALNFSLFHCCLCTRGNDMIFSKPLKRCMNSIIECNKLPWLLSWLTDILDSIGNYLQSQDLSDREVSADCTFSIHVSEGCYIPSPIVNFLSSLIRNTSDCMGAFEHDCDPNSDIARIIASGLRSIVCAPLMYIKFGLPGFHLNFTTDSSWKLYFENVKYLVELTHPSVFYEILQYVIPVRMISYKRDCQEIGGILRLELDSVSIYVMRLLEATQGLGDKDRNNVVLLVSYLYFGTLFSLESTLISSIVLNKYSIDNELHHTSTILVDTLQLLVFSWRSDATTSFFDSIGDFHVCITKAACALVSEKRNLLFYVIQACLSCSLLLENETLSIRFLDLMVIHVRSMNVSTCILLLKAVCGFFGRKFSEKLYNSTLNCLKQILTYVNDPEVILNDLSAEAKEALQEFLCELSNKRSISSNEKLSDEAVESSKRPKLEVTVSSSLAYEDRIMFLKLATDLNRQLVKVRDVLNASMDSVELANGEDSAPSKDHDSANKELLNGFSICLDLAKDIVDVLGVENSSAS